MEGVPSLKNLLKNPIRECELGQKKVKAMNPVLCSMRTKKRCAFMRKKISSMGAALRGSLCLTTVRTSRCCIRLLRIHMESMIRTSSHFKEERNATISIVQK